MMNPETLRLEKMLIWCFDDYSTVNTGMWQSIMDHEAPGLPIAEQVKLMERLTRRSQFISTGRMTLMFPPQQPSN